MKDDFLAKMEIKRKKLDCVKLASKALEEREKNKEKLKGVTIDYFDEESYSSSRQKNSSENEVVRYYPEGNTIVHNKLK